MREMRNLPGGARPGTLGRIMILVFCILAFNIDASANLVKDSMRRGAQQEKQGQYFRAAETYLGVLGLEPRHRKARARLTRIIDPAIAEKLSSATALEADLLLDEALAEIEAARRLLERSASVNIEGGQPGEVESRRLQLVDRRVRALLMEADREREDGLWSAALALLQRIQSLSPGFEGTLETMRDVWVAWADTDVREGRLRAAAERLEEAARIPGERSSVASARVATIRSRLGLSELQRGACRSAVADLLAAERLAPGSIDSGALELAVACAGTCLRLRVTADPGSGLGENQQGLLSAEVRRQVASGASEFLLLRDADAERPAACDRRLVPGIDGQPMSVGPYSASVRATALSMIRQPASSFTRQNRTWHGVHGETVVTHQEYEEIISGTMSGWVTVADQRSGGASIPLPVRVTGEAPSRWQGNAVSAVTSRPGSQGQWSTGVVIGGRGQGRAQADEARSQARARLTERLVQSFAAEAARVLLSVVDAEPAVPDPIVLADAEVR